MEPDIINTAFIAGGAVVLFINVYKLIQDKSVAGVSLIPTLFFSIWAIWNLYWFTYLDQPWSFIGACFMLVANFWWVGLALRYRQKENK
jgi:hypothetical protein